MAYIISSGESSEGIILENESMTVLNGGIANDTTVNDGGWLDVDGGGTANSTTVNDWGLLDVSSGGVATITTVNAYGTIEVYSDGVANSTTVNLYGSMHVYSGGVANNTTVNSGGNFNVDFGGVANSTTLNIGGYLFVPAGGTATEIVENGGYADIEEGANVTFAPNTFSGLILSDAAATIHSGTTANSTTVNSYGYLYVSSGGTANNTTVNGGELYVFSGGTANSATVYSGGYLYVSSGGTATEIVAADGAYLYFAVAPDTYIQGTSAGSAFEIKDGAVSNYTVNDGELYVSSGGTANSTTVNSWGHLYVSSGGTANSTTVNSDGYLRVFSGGTANSTTVNSWGSMWVYSGGSAIGPTVNSWSELDVFSGGTATEIVENGGYVNVQEGANVTFAPNTFSGLILSNASATIHSGATANSTTVNSGGRLYVYSGGTAIGTTVNSGGRLYVSAGGTATEIVWTPCEGHVYVSDGGYATFVSQYSGVYYGSGNKLLSNTAVMDGKKLDAAYEMCVMNRGTANSTTVSSGGNLIVSSGGTANSTTLNRGGDLDVSSGGTANNTTVNSGGRLIVSSGGTANNTTVNSWGLLYILSGGTANSTTVNSYGRLYVYSGGTANSITVNSYGYLFVSSGGTADNATVNSGGNFNVSSGGTANSTTISSGGRMWVSSGGRLTGLTTIENGANVSAYSGAILDFDISSLTPEAGARVNNLAIIRGTPLYTLTVSAEQAKGVYTLANGAAKFIKSTITVQNTLGETLGTLTVGGNLDTDDRRYTLNLNEGALTLSVEVPPSPPVNLVGTADGVSWEYPAGADLYEVNLSTDDFGHAFRWLTDTTAQDLYELPGGTYQWRVMVFDDGEDWAVGEDFVSENDPGTAKVVRSNADGVDDIFFASANGTWSREYFAQHAGSLDEEGWTGTGEFVSANGKGRIQNLFFGSSDPSILCLTDGENGDAIFLDDVYTELPEELEANTARLLRIREIWAGAGDDIIDMTSQRFEYVGGGQTLCGGDGNDTIWANKGANWLFGDAGDDRITGASGNDVIAGGIGDDRMHGGGGDDVFTFCENWGTDTVKQLAGGSVTLWFASGSIDNWDEETLTYSDGDNCVKVSGVTAEQVTLKFGAGETPDDEDQFASLSNMGAFEAFTTRKIFEEATLA